MILRIYDYMVRHRGLRWALLLITTVVLTLSVMQLSYNEDISDFLPLDTTDREALSIYQDISDSDNLVVIFEKPVNDAIDLFCKAAERRDTKGWMRGRIQARIDMEKMEQVQDFVYRNIPYFLTKEDYIRMDSLLSEPDYADSQFTEDEEMMAYSVGVVSNSIRHDPLNLFYPVMMQLIENGEQAKFEIIDGYIYTPDSTRALVTIASPFGNAETEKNAQLVAILDSAIADMQHTYPNVKAHVTGGPQIAVGNAEQIKKDSALAVSIAVILILCVLYLYFRSVRKIILIAVSIAWGWLFALGGLALIQDRVSIIVLGMSSVILGIAINYPLHLVAHTSHTDGDMRQTLKEIVRPLLIGNITTIGAFMALIPLQAAALRDLGIFASLQLAGTIIFVLVFLPHLMPKTGEVNQQPTANGQSAPSPLNSNLSTLTFTLLIAITAVFAWFSLGVSFDTDMSHINYMTDDQRADMEVFKPGQDSDHYTTLYVTSSASSWDEALDANQRKQATIDRLAGKSIVKTGEHRVTQYLVSKKEQERRLAMWRDFVKVHKKEFGAELDAAARRNGFDPEMFKAFHELIDNDAYEPKVLSYFQPLTRTLLAGCMSEDSITGRHTIVAKIQVKEGEADNVREMFRGSFDTKSMNAALASSLSDNFNYIGIVCSCVVFFFLWASFGKIELAIISFLPMAVSWVWILGIMSLLGISFNIVNIILATFIFGQGDDYTIFMTEGCHYEYVHRKPMLKVYRNSVLLSAIIMFTGIGILILAKHPALHSLAEITIIGMVCVVVMAWIIPPLCFRLLTHSAFFRKRLLSKIF